MLLENDTRVAIEFKDVIGDPACRFVHPYRQKYLKILLGNIPDSVDQIWVFGSAITMDNGPESDLDVLLIGDDIGGSEKKIIYKLLSLAGFDDNSLKCTDVDIITANKTDFINHINTFGHLFYEIWRKGLLYYDKQWITEPYRMPVSKEEYRTDNLDGQYLYLARIDLEGAQMFLGLGNDEGHINNSAYHCQQAIEKIIKSYSMTNGIIPDKTHKIGSLLSRLDVSGIDISIFDEVSKISDKLTDWEAAGRYYTPVLASAKELNQMFAIIKDLIDKLAPHVVTAYVVQNVVVNKLAGDDGSTTK